jgi:uracil-DNA glycosylase
MPKGVFPFGQKVRAVRQEDRSPKEVFVLGVYASAVHARWTDRHGKQRVPALAVASEPYIFWTGEGATDLIARVRIPAALGTLSPAAEMHNGPSGRSLDERFLRPLGLTRNDVWLCDLYPFSMLNDRQLNAIRRKYTPLASRHKLPKPSLEKAPSESPGHRRVQEIAAEITESRARTLLLLGDLPIAWFLHALSPGRRRLSQFGKSPSEYGRLHRVDITGTSINVLPLVHPRQASSLGASSPSWRTIHDNWVDSVARTLLR